SQSEVRLKYDNSAVPLALSDPVVFSGSGSVTDRGETDRGATAPGPGLRETGTAYKTLGKHILGLPGDIKVKEGRGKVFSDTVMSYDEPGSVQSVSPLPTGHDNTNYSATSTTPRGNLTSVTRYADATADGGGVTTKYTYDMLGNRTNAQVG